MKIGIVSSGVDMLGIFSLLHKYDHEYVLYYDFAHGAYGDQTFQQNMQQVLQGIDFLIAQGVDKIILPPVYELDFLEEEKRGTKLGKIVQNRILPLFSTYVMQECFAHSLVGKIGLLGDFADIQVAQEQMKALAKDYVLSPAQQAIRSFQAPFAYRTKEVNLWKYFLMKLSFSDMMVNKLIKFDLRYFKDAMVDTLIPLNYGYFVYQTTISKFLNFKKIRFHKLDKLEKIFQSLLTPSTTPYRVQVYHTGHAEFLIREKKWMWMLGRGKNVAIEFHQL